MKNGKGNENPNPNPNPHSQSHPNQKSVEKKDLKSFPKPLAIKSK